MLLLAPVDTVLFLELVLRTFPLDICALRLDFSRYLACVALKSLLSPFAFAMDPFLTLVLLPEDETFPPLLFLAPILATRPVLSLAIGA